jgi:hypothetical protein
MLALLMMLLGCAYVYSTAQNIVGQYQEYVIIRNWARVKITAEIRERDAREKAAAARAAQPAPQNAPAPVAPQATPAPTNPPPSGK